MLDLLNTLDISAKNDLHGEIARLPGLLYPCSRCTNEWRRGGDILTTVWACLVALGTTFSSAYAVVTMILEGLEPQREDEALGVSRSNVARFQS